MAAEHPWPNPSLTCRPGDHAGNLIHSKELERGDEAEQLAEIADAHTAWQVAHAIGLVSILVFAVAIAGLAALVAREAPRVGLVGGALAMAGLIGFASVIAIDGFTWGTLGDVSARSEADARTLEPALRELQESGWSLLFYVTPIGFILGLIVLSAGMVRHGLAPRWAGGLLAVGALMVGTEAAIISNAYFIAGAAVLLAGGVAVAYALARPPNRAQAA